MNRRPIAQRSAGWAKRMACELNRAGVSPNAISIASAGFSILGACALAFASEPLKPAALIAFAFCIQLRLLCNMLDGMVAVEYDKASFLGELFNEIPDRFADVIFIVGFGLFAQESEAAGALAWVGGILAVMTAYIRAVGAQLTSAQDYSGPMAKPRRMFVLTVGSFGSALLLAGNNDALWLILTTLAIIAIGSGLTVVNRLRRLSKRLRKDAGA